VKAQSRPKVQGPEALVGEKGRVMDAIPGGSAPGKVVFHGEIWDAISDQPLIEESQVEVVGIEGRVARVKPVVKS
jgi:membrane-bound ClpP family serine protease